MAYSPIANWHESRCSVSTVTGTCGEIFQWSCGKIHFNYDSPLDE